MTPDERNLSAAAWLSAHAPTTAQAMSAAVMYDCPATAALIALADSPAGAGFLTGVTLGQIADLEDALRPFDWYRDRINPVLSSLAEKRRALDLSADTLTPITRPELMQCLADAGIADGVIPLDDDYLLCDYATLERIAPHITNLRLLYGDRTSKFRAECNHSGRVQWGRLADLTPCRLAAGAAAITHDLGAHFVVIAVIRDRTVWVIENDGALWQLRNGRYGARSSVSIAGMMI